MTVRHQLSLTEKLGGVLSATIVIKCACTLILHLIQVFVSNRHAVRHIDVLQAIINLGYKQMTEETQTTPPPPSTDASRDIAVSELFELRKHLQEPIVTSAATDALQPSPPPIPVFIAPDEVEAFSQDVKNILFQVQSDISSATDVVVMILPIMKLASKYTHLSGPQKKSIVLAVLKLVIKSSAALSETLKATILIGIDTIIPPVIDSFYTMNMSDLKNDVKSFFSCCCK